MHEIKKCNTCGSTYPSNLSFCLNDGTPLVEVNPMLGVVLDGRYRLDSLIGVGGMGDVYRATHVHLDTEFAVKLLKPEFVADQTAIKRFRLEAKAAGRIHHPNAVRVTDFGVTPDRTVYLVMELVTGYSLRRLIRQEGTLDYLRTVNLMRQVCGAVEAAHRAGVIHRDLKPDNILIEAAHNLERVKVLDFGIAKLRETKTTDAFLTMAGTIIGTPQYMSPEQCQGKQLDPASDIYSLGIILYEMLSGSIPFDGETTLQIVYDQLHQNPRPLLDVAPEVPPAVANVVMRTLEKEPEARQASASQLSDELREAVESLGEGPALSMTSPLIRPLESGIRTPSKEISLSLETRTTEEDEETRLRPRPDEAETLKRPIEPEKPTAQTNSRRGLVFGGLAVLVLALAALAYVAMRSKAPSPQPPSGAPEGMVLIPGGSFTMGRNDGSADEGPAHPVTIAPFYLDAQEVTNQEYKKFVDATRRPAPRNWTQNGSYAPEEALFPVTYVTWNDAVAYATWAGKRLPTEAEWEYAARGGKDNRYPWGNQWEPNAANVDRKGHPKPAPVRSFERDISPFGIYDLAGNVSEWVQDFYSERYGATPDQRFRVYRGGNFLDAPDKATTTYRWSDFPNEIPADQMLRVGFRCAKDADKK